MTVHGMVFNNITPPHKTPNNVGQVEYCVYTDSWDLEIEGGHRTEISLPI